MLGKASEIKTKFVEEIKFREQGFQYALDDALEQLEDSEIIEIKTMCAPDADGIIWYSALIIYKE